MREREPFVQASRIFTALFSWSRRSIPLARLISTELCSDTRLGSLSSRRSRMGFRTLLLTNNSRERVERFVRNIDTLYLCEAGKPGPEGYLKAAGLLGLEREELVCIGDQIFTDILGANRSGMASVIPAHTAFRNRW